MKLSSVRPSVHPISRTQLRRVCCCGPGDIDRLLHGRRSAANATSRCQLNTDLHSYATERRSKPSVAVGQMVDEAVTGLR